MAQEFVARNGIISKNDVLVQGDLTANTISSTTIETRNYLGLPKDIYVTGGTYSSGTATFKNNSGGTFNVTGFSTGGASIPIYNEGSTVTNNLVSMNFVGSGVDTTSDGSGNVTVTIPGSASPGGGCSQSTTLIASNSSRYLQDVGLTSTQYYFGDDKCGWNSCDLNVIYSVAGDPVLPRNVNSGIPFPMDLIEGDVITLSGIAYCPDAHTGNKFNTAMETFSCHSYNSGGGFFDVTNVLNTQTDEFQETYVCFSVKYILQPGDFFYSGTDFILVGFRGDFPISIHVSLTWTLNIYRDCNYVPI